VNTETRHIIYISQLAPERGCAVFSAICRSARSYNIERGIAGVLLFDGERFFQWLHGAHDEVSQLMDTITADPRHTQVRVLLNAQWPTPEHERGWRAGFVDPEALDAFAALDPADGSAMLDGLAGLVAQADLDPVLRVTMPTGQSTPPADGA
jgi:hypothetical protein